MDRNYGASYFEQRLRNRMYEAVIRALERECDKNSWKRKDIAKRSGAKESQVSRWLSGPGNWTLDTVSRLLYAIDAELDFSVTLFKDKKKHNEFHPLNSVLSVQPIHLGQAPKKLAQTAQGIVHVMGAGEY